MASGWGGSWMRSSAAAAAAPWPCSVQRSSLARGCPSTDGHRVYINTAAHELRPLATIHTVPLPQHPSPPPALLPLLAFLRPPNVCSCCCPCAHGHLDTRPPWPPPLRRITTTSAASRAQRPLPRRYLRSASPSAHLASATAMAQSAHMEHRRQITPPSPSRPLSPRSSSSWVTVGAGRHVC